MAIGPGKYDGVARMLVTAMNARGVIVVVAKGPRGDGVSGAFDTDRFTIDDAEAMAAALRRAADGIVDETKRMLALVNRSKQHGRDSDEN